MASECLPTPVGSPNDVPNHRQRVIFVFLRSKLGLLEPFIIGVGFSFSLDLDDLKRVFGVGRT
jgi:hypothetical protein